MSDTIAITQILNGLQRAVVRINYSSDGTGSAAQTVYSSSANTTTVAASIKNFTDSKMSRIMKIEYSGMLATAARAELLWKGTANLQALVLPGYAFGYTEDFEKIGGLANPITLVNGRNGDILLTVTTPSAGDFFTLILTIEYK